MDNILWGGNIIIGVFGNKKIWIIKSAWCEQWNPIKGLMIGSMKNWKSIPQVSPQMFEK